MPTALQQGCDAKTGVDCYLLGLVTQVVGKTTTKAAELYRFRCAATRGNGWGWLNPGDMYMRGNGVTASSGDAAHYYNEVCTKRVGGGESFIAEWPSTAPELDGWDGAVDHFFFLRTISIVTSPVSRDRHDSRTFVR